MAYRRREFSTNQRVQRKSVNLSILGTFLRCTIIYMEPLVVQPSIGAVNFRGSLYATGRYLRVRKRVGTMIIGLRGAFTLEFEAEKKWHFGLHQLRLHVLHGLLLPAAATTTLFDFKRLYQRGGSPAVAEVNPSRQTGILACFTKCSAALRFVV